MLKALLAASIAMLACCTAAALAGPVHYGMDVEPAAVTIPDYLDDLAGEAAVLHRKNDVSSPGLQIVPADDFVSLTSITMPYTRHMTASREAATVPDDSLQPAVIPLPTPLYAAAALLTVTLAARRAILRAC